MAHIYYWQGALGQNELLNEHAEAIQKLLSGEYRSLNLEKLNTTCQSKPIYSVRLNAAARLLFTTHRVDGRDYILVLEHLPTHDYQKSYVLRGGALPKFEALNESPIAASTTQEPLEYQAVDYFNKQYIQLSVHQEHALQTSLPLVISGVAGAGKTFVALSLLRQTLAQQAYDETMRLVYITKETQLVTEMQRAWQDWTAGKPSAQVQFLTYQDWLKQYLPDAHICADGGSYHAWSTQQKPSAHGLSTDTEFQEFRICAALTLDEYLNLGVNQSACPVEKRSHVYTDFQRFMRAQQVIDPAFYRLEHAANYDCIVVDEAQNLSLVQQANLYRLAKEHTVAFCMDAHQNLIDQCAMQTLLEAYLWNKEHRAIKSIYLANTFRCSAQVVGVVNNLLQAQFAVMGKVEKKSANMLVADESLSTGEVHVITPEQLSADEYAHILERKQTTQFAVVTQAHLVEEARHLFGTYLVFTVEKIQGLGYDTVVVYKLWDNEASRQNLSRIHHGLMQARTAKGEQAQLRDSAPLFNHTYTAYTRAQRTLLICETPVLSSRIKRHALLDRLMNGITSPCEIVTEAIQPASQEDWDLECVRLEQNGLCEMAAQVRQQVTAQQEKVMAIWNNFENNSFLSKFIDSAEFLRLLFGVAVQLTPTQPAQSLFLSIIRSDAHLRRFVTIMNIKNWHSSACIHLIIRVRKLPPLLQYKLMHHILRLKYQQTPEEVTQKMQLWVKAELKKTTVRESICQSFPNAADIIGWFNLAITQKEHALISQDDLIAFLSLRHNNLNCSLLTVIMKSPNLQPSVMSLVMKMRFSNELWLEALLHSYSGVPSNVKLFHQICTLPSQMNFFLTHYPEVLRAISAEHWLTPFCLPNSTCTASALYRFSRKSEERQILMKLLTQHPEIITKLPANSWIQSVDDMTLLHCLTLNLEGREILLTLLNNYPEIMQQISPQSWHAILPVTDDKNPLHNTSPLYCLCVTQDGIHGVNVLNKLLDDYPAILLSNPDMWARHVYILNKDMVTNRFFMPDNTRNLYNSMLYMLSTSSSGRALLMRLFREAPSFINSIPCNAWTNPGSINDANGLKVSPLVMMMGPQTRQEFLHLLSNNHPKLYQCALNDSARLTLCP
jgi:hypothetical protein